MRWQKTARLAIAAFVIVFGAVVFVALRRPEPPRPVEGPVREDPKTVAETRGTEGEPLPVYKRFSPDGKALFSLAYEKQRTYADGRSVFINGTITMPDRGGRTVTIRGGEMEVITPQNDARPVSTVKLTHGVTLRTSDGVEVTGDNATYDETSGMLNVPGDVRFTKGRLSGSGVGATYDRDRDVVWLLERAKVAVTPDEQGKGAMDATAGSAGLARADHYLRLTKNGHIVGEGRTLDADDITIQLTPDDRQIQDMALRGNSRIAGGPGSGGAEGMSARDIDLTYAPDGRTLQQAKLIENAAVQLAGGAGSGARKVSGRMIDITMGPDGSTVTGLNASQNVQVDIPASADVPARQINASALSAGGPSGLQTATFTGGVTYREIRGGGRGTTPGERTGRSERLIVETQPGLGAIQQADFRGNVRIEDGATTAEGQRAIYHVAQDKFDIAPSPGDPGPSPSVNDGRVLVGARTISFTIGSKQLSAETDVRSSLQPARRDPAAGGRGRKPAVAEGGKLPSMLKPDEIVNVKSNRLEYDGAAERATYTGDVRLWQDKTTVKGDTVVLDDRTGNLTADGKVTTIMFFDEVDATTKTKKPVEMIATGDTMVYEEATRKATYTTGPTAKAHIVGTQGDVTADRIELFLKQAASELERAEADGHVVVKEGFRTATGNHLTYTTADDTYLMNGSPVEVEERKPSECTVTVASRLSFKRSAVTTHIFDDGLTPVTVKPCVAK